MKIPSFLCKSSLIAPLRLCLQPARFSLMSEKGQILNTNNYPNILYWELQCKLIRCMPLQKERKLVQLLSSYSRFHKNCNILRIHYGGGGRYWSYFWGKNRPIYMAYCSFLVLGGPLDTGSRPSVVDD